MISSTTPMLSRVADSIYWMSRYIERAENIARFIDVNLHLVLDLPVAVKQQWEPLVNITGDHNIFTDRYGLANRDTVIGFLVFDPMYTNSILSCLRSARELARSVREVISSEMWESVNDFYYFVISEMSRRMAAEDTHSFFAEVKLHSQKFSGVSEGTFSHGEGWHFLRLGSLIERAEKTSRMLDMKYFILLPNADYVGSAYDNIQWAAVLKSASALEMYRKRFHGILPKQVCDFLIFDRDFPRSIRYCVIKAQEALHRIASASSGSFLNQAERQLGRLRAELDYADIDEVFALGFHQYLDSIQAKMNNVDDAIFKTYFELHPSGQFAGSKGEQ